MCLYVDRLKTNLQAGVSNINQSGRTKRRAAPTMCTHIDVREKPFELDRSTRQGHLERGCCTRHFFRQPLLRGDNAGFAVTTVLSAPSASGFRRTAVDENMGWRVWCQRFYTPQFCGNRVPTGPAEPYLVQIGIVWSVILLYPSQFLQIQKII
jgi:hypothetical protein